jgi:hypothetical protein
MRGRDPRQPHRVSTPLELLFDLTFVLGTAPRDNAPRSTRRITYERGVAAARDGPETLYA